MSRYFSNSTLLIGLAFIFLIFIVYCGSYHTGLECDAHLFLTSYLYEILLFIIVNLSVFFRRKENFTLIGTPPSLIFLWFREFASKIYNPILEDFRRGIIHSQIYNYRLVSS